MAYVRTSRSRGKEYRQIVESYREDGKVKQRVLVHIGWHETPEAAAEWYELATNNYRRIAASEAEKADQTSAEWERWLERHGQWCLDNGFPYPEPRDYRRGRLMLSRRREAEHSARTAEKYEAKARVLRDLLASGKIKPDAPEVREERERRRQEGLAKLRKLESSLSRR